MDEVLEKLETTFISPAAKDDPKSFESLYKNWGKLGSQEDRRKEILEHQKSNRHCRLDKLRGILDLVNVIEARDIASPNYKLYRPSIYVAGFHRVSLSYNNVLMMSEWMIEKPEDFSENWYMTPCPKGWRMLMVAGHGKTKFYTKYGQFKFECRTALPGGNLCKSNNKNVCCVLDCFYHEKTKTAYVLDMLAWNNQPMTDGETEFRHYWLQTKFNELPELQSINKYNKVIFSLLPKEPCTLDSLNRLLMTYPPFKDNLPATDGLLFYHKRAHYVSGETPLVGWLYPYMVPEVIGPDVSVHELFLLEKPVDYVNQADFIQKFNKKKPSRYQTGKARTSMINAMDTAEVKENECVSKLTAFLIRGGPVAVFGVETNGQQSTENMDADETAKHLEEIPDAKVMT